MKREDVGEEGFSAGPDTRVNGPFKIEEWDVDAQTHSIVQNPAWWGETKHSGWAITQLYPHDRDYDRAVEEQTGHHRC